MDHRRVIATNLRVLRELRGLSQEQLAARASLSRRTIARLEAEQVLDPGVAQLRALSLALAVPLETVITEPLALVRVPLPERLLPLLETERGALLLAELGRERPL